MISKKPIKIVRGRVLLVVSILLATVMGCGSIERLVRSEGSHRTEDYRRAFERWTKEARIYRGLDMELIVSATFKSADYRKGYAREYAETYLLSDEDELKFKRDQMKAAEEFHDFVMAAFIPDDKWNDFEKKDSIWKIYLSNDKNDRISPLEIRKLNKKDPVVGQFFPYVSPWRQVYALRFAVTMPGQEEAFISADTRSITLTLTGVRGTCDMFWELKIEE